MIARIFRVYRSDRGDVDVIARRKELCQRQQVNPQM